LVLVEEFTVSSLILNTFLQDGTELRSAYSLMATTGTRWICGE